MKNKILKVLVIVTLISALFITTSLARSSYYIDSTTATAAKSGTTGFKVSFSITATGPMTSIGATKIEIKNSQGLLVKTFYASNPDNAAMMGSNKTYHSGSVTYNGTAGTTYYAVVTFKAENSSGYDTTSNITGTVRI